MHLVSQRLPVFCALDARLLPCPLGANEGAPRSVAAGVPAVRATVETCAQMGVQALTLYAFSIENWKRPRAEVEMLWRLLRHYLKRELPTMERHDVRFGAIGRLDALPAS